MCPVSVLCHLDPGSGDGVGSFRPVVPGLPTFPMGDSDHTGPSFGQDSRTSILSCDRFSRL